ncbi:helix-turn-helix domain-containing protein [Pseudonocardia sp. DSM 45834]|uniref:Helix-turn-helix domain-containing protein n=1 Tax=Pseudonocardia charpentierae TaxID=3075545 RepID=A0ABU2NFG9_9PSEU|nr:helix-turn-helix domain-containing protein [Pseudonocardia sp. DSM 45834]MDT0352717.1 helix-turn-helix domain-containing protein [Pseudonocardia sp. DSM 45834]
MARAEITADPDVKLNAIAQRAGVGQATLYRHFPTRADLLAEVYRAEPTSTHWSRPPTRCSPTTTR